MNLFCHSPQKGMEQQSDNQQTFSPLRGEGWCEGGGGNGSDSLIPLDRSKDISSSSLLCFGGGIILFLCFFLLSGCGYQLVGKETHLPPGVASIAIPTFANQTFEPGAEIPFTQAFLTEFIRDRRIKILDRREADSVLEGTIKSILFRSVSYDATGLVQEYRTTVVVDLILRRRGGEIIWRENNLTETRWFRTTSSILDNEANRFNSIQEVGVLVAERVRNRFFYNF